MIQKKYTHPGLLILTALLMFAFSGIASGAPLDDLLQKYPAQNAQDFQALNAQLIQLGDGGITDLCGRLTPSATGGDAQARYAINGLTKYIQLQSDETARKMVIHAFLTSLDTATDTDIKTFLINQLQFIGEQEAIAPLSRYLTNEALCEPAAQALFAIKTSEASAALLFALPQAGDSLKPTIIKTLGDLRSRAAALALIPFTESSDLNTRLMAYFAIANIGDPSAANPLQRALTKTDGYERAQAISAYLLFAHRLAEAQADEDALTIFQSVLNTYTSAEDVSIQCAALDGLVSIQGENALDTLLEAMKSPYADYRNKALTLAKGIEGQKATWRWIEKCKTASPEVKAEILIFLGTRGDTIALPTLLEALQDTNPDVVQSAVEASFRLGGLESVPFYSDLLRSNNQPVIDKVKETLLQVSGDYLLTTISYILPTVSTPAKVALLDIIGERKADLFYPDVYDYASNEDSAIRLAAIRALQTIAGPDTIGDLMKLLEKSSGDEAQSTEKVIGAVMNQFGSDTEKVDFLVKAFANIADEKKVYLLHLLGEIRGDAALHATAPYLKNDVLKKDAAQTVIGIVCPQEGDGFGLCTDEAYNALTDALPLLDNAEQIENAKKHLPAPLAQPDGDGFISLFNGQDLSGWIWNGKSQDGKTAYFVKDGVMTCNAEGVGNIYTDREFADFIYRFDFKLVKAANNGVGIRAPLYGDAAYTGMEIQILDHDDPEYNWIKPYQAHGSVYGVIPAERGYLKPLGEWNSEEIKIDGRYITVTLNDHVITQGHLDQARMPQTADGHDHPGLGRTKGHIAFLGHGYPVEFRGMRIKELNKEPRPDNVPPEGFTALFNGQDLTGWKGLVANPPERAKMTPEQLAEAQAKADESMRAHWQPTDGVLVFDGKGDSLCTAKDYSDFEMLVDWKIKEKGDSGIYLRGSPQVQIWDITNFGFGSGGLYNNQKNQANPTIIADHPIGEWNTFRIIMVGDRVTVYLNDQLVTDNVIMENYWERDKPIYPTGQIELQNHGNTLYFKNIYIRELPRE